MNNVNFIGRFAADPELRKTGEGISVCSFTLAVDRPGTFGDAKKTDWIDMVGWRGTAEFICRNFEKGTPAAVRGTLQSRNWEKDGQKRKTLEVIIEEIDFLPRSKDRQEPKVDQGQIQETVSFAVGEAADFEPVNDEDLPF